MPVDAAQLRGVLVEQEFRCFASLSMTWGVALVMPLGFGLAGI
jgi:hypothetical protein